MTVRINLDSESPTGSSVLSAKTQKKKIMITPALVVGLGGTGMRVLSLFKQRILAMCGERAPLAFLGIDTDREDLPGAPLGKDEFAPAECMQAPHIVENLKNFPDIEAWWHPGMRPGEIHKGAQMKRPVGRLACFYNFNREIQWRLQDQVNHLKLLVPPSEQTPFDVRDDAIRVYVVGSLSGGPGAVSFLILQWPSETRSPGPSVRKQALSLWA